MESRLSVTFSLLAADPVSAGGERGGPQVSHQPGRGKKATGRAQPAAEESIVVPNRQEPPSPFFCQPGGWNSPKDP